MRSLLSRLLSFLVASIVIGAMLVPSAAGSSLSAASFGVHSRTAKPVNAAIVAKKLAAAVYGARTAQGRYAALLAVMKTLHVGVYTKRLKRLVHGAERGPRDFYLYDFELVMLASALQRGEMQSVTELSSILASVLTPSGGTPPDPDTLRRILLSGVQQAAQHPHDRLSLVPLLVRELGRHHASPYDMTTDVPIDQLQFDRLQSLLILSDVLVPIIQKVKHLGTSHIVGRSLGVFQPAADAPSAPCTGGFSQFAQGIWPFGKWSAPVILNFAGNAVAARSVGIATEALDVIHMNILAAGVVVTLLTPSPTGTNRAPHLDLHYGPPGHAPNAGQPMRITILVRMDLDLRRLLGDLVVNCGSIVMKLPQVGPIPNVSVIWTNSGVFPHGVHDLADFGTVTEQAKTDSNGQATFLFQPKDEQFPGFGDEITLEDGYIRVWSLYQSAFGSALGSLVQFFGKDQIVDFKLTRHRPRGFKFGPVTLAWDAVFSYAQTPPCTSNCNDGCDPRYCHGYTVSEHEEWMVTGRICGDDPHGQWQITTHNAGQGRAQDGYVFSTVGADRANGTEYWTLADDNVFRYVGGPATDVPVTTKTGSFQVGPPPQVTIHITTTSGGNPAWSPIDQTKTVPVTEDTSCPDNSTSA